MQAFLEKPGHTANYGWTHIQGHTDHCWYPVDSLERATPSMPLGSP